MPHFLKTAYYYRVILNLQNQPHKTKKIERKKIGKLLGNPKSTKPTTKVSFKMIIANWTFINSPHAIALLANWLVG
jgi:hypothetical protein